jgi:transcriptional regulator with XRE-family HTH domain
MTNLFDQSKQNIALAISQRRKALGISQEGLALAADIDRTYISQLERKIANPSLSILCKVASVLECDLVDLINTKEII